MNSSQNVNVHAFVHGMKVHHGHLVVYDVIAVMNDGSVNGFSRLVSRKHCIMKT